MSPLRRRPSSCAARWWWAPQWRTAPQRRWPASAVLVRWRCPGGTPKVAIKYIYIYVYILYIYYIYTIYTIYIYTIYRVYMGLSIQGWHYTSMWLREFLKSYHFFEQNMDNHSSLAPSSPPDFFFCVFCVSSQLYWGCVWSDISYHMHQNELPRGGICINNLEGKVPECNVIVGCLAASYGFSETHWALQCMKVDL